MFPNIAINLFLAVAAIPFIYYLLALYSSWNYFRQRTPSQSDPNFTPPVSNLKPVRGLDPEAYENFASFCRQDYPDYEIFFCVGDHEDPVLPVIEKLVYDFPERKIRSCSTAPVASPPTTKWPSSRALWTKPQRIPCHQRQRCSR